MSSGTSTPIEVAIAGPDFAATRKFAATVKERLAGIRTLRDVQYAQLLEYPSLNIHVDRERAGQLGVSMQDVGQALVAATSSTRFTQPNFWAAPNGVSYQVQVEVPQFLTSSAESVEAIPVAQGQRPYPLVGDVASISEGTIIGQYDRYNQQRMITVTADIADVDLGTAAREVSAALRAVGEAPPGTAVMVRGQIAPMEQTLAGLQRGLVLAVLAIFLLLGAFFQSLRLALVVIAAIPAAIAGVLAALTLADSTLNVQSFMGAIVSIGIAVANAILLATFAERARISGAPATEAAIDGAQSRLRPILMTTSAMVVGMVPLAAGSGQSAPLGQAVIGGLVGATFATLLALPAFFALVQSRAPHRSPSLDPFDPGSSFHEPGLQERP
jgi:multidrug efflux pump subunit AcrB